MATISHAVWHVMTRFVYILTAFACELLTGTGCKQLAKALESLGRATIKGHPLHHPQQNGDYKYANYNEAAAGELIQSMDKQLEAVNRSRS